MATDLLKNLAYLAMNWAQLAIDPGKLCYLVMATITTKIKCTTMTSMADLWAECPQSPCPDCCQRSTCTHQSCPPWPSWWSESGDFHDFQSGNCCHSPAAVSDGTIWNFNSEINSISHWYNNVFKIHLILKVI